MADAKKPKPIGPFGNYVLAATAGSSAWMFVHPFEVIKTRMMASEGKNPNPLRLVADLGRQEGIPGLYAGLSAGILRQLTYTGLRVGLFNTLTDYFKDKPKTMYNGKVGVGLSAGAIGAAIVCPVEVSMVRMANDAKLPVEQRRNYGHVFDAIARIGREEGVSAMFRGVGATMGRGMLVTVTQLGTNEQCKEMLKEQGLSGFKLTATAAMISSVVVCVCSNPLDAAKVRMQGQVVDPVTGAKPYPHLPGTLMKMAANEGVLSWWKGLFPWYLRGGGHTVGLLIFMDLYKDFYQSM